MTRLDQSNIISFVKSFLTESGISAEAVNDYFDTSNFDSALVIKLAPVCLMPKNKPLGSRSKQTHIHITGMPRYFFFPPAELHTAVTSTLDFPYHTHVSMANIRSLRRSNLAFQDLGLQESYTLTKIAVRQNQDTQVQISKIKGDDAAFIELRSNLYLNDLLILLNSFDNSRRLAIGVPATYYTDKGINIENTSVFFNLGDNSAVKVKKALRSLETSYDSHEMLSDLDGIDDAIYQQQLYMTPPTTTDIKPMPKANKTEIQGERHKRSAARGREAIKDGNYMCAIDHDHATFISRSGDPYVEAHHLIPISNEDDFEYSLDVKSNIVPLCPICHMKIHYGQPLEVQEMVEQLYEVRKDVLVQSGLEVDLAKLKGYYT